MKKRINDLLFDMQAGRKCIGETANELEKLLGNRSQGLKYVPYQSCPACNGLGEVAKLEGLHFVNKTCDVCNGEKIIPMHIVEEIHEKASEPVIIFGADIGNDKDFGVELYVTAKGDIAVIKDETT